MMRRPVHRLAGLLSIALLMLSAGAVARPQTAAAFDTPAPQITEVAQESLSIAFAAPDGSLWNLAPRADRATGATAITLTRFDADGVLSRGTVAEARPPERVSLIKAPTTFADGTVGLLLRRERAHVTDVQLLRVSAAGRAAGTVSLPQSARRAAGFALERDGSVWWARACEDELYRRAPDGRTTLTRLPRGGCGVSADRGSARELEDGTGLAVGDDGAVWVVNLCGRRIVRLNPAGQLRQWRPAKVSCVVWGTATEQVSQALVTPDQRGGIAWFTPESSAYVRMGGTGGRVLPGGRLLTAAPGSRGGFFDLSGAHWQLAARVAPDGVTVTPLALPDGRSPAVIAPARGGGAWLVGSRTTYVDQYKQSYWWYDDAAATLIAPDGSTRSWALPEMGGDERGAVSISGAALGGDGSLWVSYADGLRGPRLFRVVPPGLPAARPPAATPTRIVSRKGATAFVRLRCDADAGAWCVGRVALGGAARGVRFLIAGQQTETVPLTLGARAVITLRRGRALRTLAIARSGNATLTRKQEMVLRP